MEKLCIEFFWDNRQQRSQTTTITHTRVGWAWTALKRKAVVVVGGGWRNQVTNRNYNIPNVDGAWTGLKKGWGGGNASSRMSREAARERLVGIYWKSITEQCVKEVVLPESGVPPETGVRLKKAATRWSAQTNSFFESAR